MDTLLIVLACVCLLVGLAGSVLPVIPGPPLAYFGVLLVHWSSKVDFSNDFLLTWAAATIVVSILDYYLPVWFSKRFGGSKQATWGSAIGVVAGIFLFPPIGLIVCPFFGALIGELMHDSSQSAKAFKVAFGSFAAFICGTGLKLIVSGWMAYDVIKQLLA